MSDDEDDLTFSPIQRSWSQSPFSRPQRRGKASRLSLSQRSRKRGVASSPQKEMRIGKHKAVAKSPQKLLSSSLPNERKKTSQSFFRKGSSLTLEQNLRREVCSLCMMPWVTYKSSGKSKDYHVEECLDVDFSSIPECESGVECIEVQENHFWKFTHKALAELRADLERVVSRRLGPSVKGREDGQKKLETAHSPSSEDFAVAGPSGVKRWAPTPKGGDAQSRTLRSEISSDEGYVSIKVNRSLEHTDIDQDDFKGTRSSFGQNRPMVGKPAPVVGRNENDVGIEHSRRKSCDFFEEKEIPDLDLSSLSPIDDDERLEADQGATESQKQVTRHDGSKGDVDSEITLLFNKSHEEQNRTADFDDDDIFSSDFTDCGENDAERGNGTVATKSTPSVSLLQSANEGTGDVGTSPEQHPTKRKIVEREDGSSCADKPIWPREDERGNESVLESLIDIAVKKCYSAVDEMNDRRRKKPPDRAPPGDRDVSASQNACQGGPSCKPCIHIHLHLENNPGTSRRDGQTSILDYFQPTKAKRIPDSTAANKCTACSACDGGKAKVASEMSRAESWKEVMSAMQNKTYNIPSITDSSISSRGSKDKKQDQDKKKKWEQRRCPFYKYIPDTDIAVDAFCYGYLQGVRAYFLTHFHYDHYRGLKKSFDHHIYCSEITAKLVRLRIGVPSQYVHPLPLGESRVVCDVEVTLLDANHCPGSVMFLFKLRSGSTVLHVGDFRAHQKMESYPQLWNSSIDSLYLDTTYCNPLYDFPSQEDIIQKCVSVAAQRVHDNPKTLIVVGSYSIGKERVFKAIASSLKCMIWASTDKQKILRCIQDEEIQARLTSDKHNARVHVVPMMDLKPQKLMKYIETMKPRYNAVVAIRPTGWEHSGDSDEVLHKLSPKQYGNVYIYGIPYSEHSSYVELKRFVQFIRPKKVIPTVNVGNPTTRKSMEQDIMEWLKIK